MSSKKLKPCPFCGQKLHEVSTLRNPHAYCKTNNCKGAQLPILMLDAYEDIERWNKRIEPWISVEDRLPEESGPVLVCVIDEEGEFGIEPWAVYDDGPSCFLAYSGPDFVEIQNATHWMPLPTPPEVASAE